MVIFQYFCSIIHFIARLGLPIKTIELEIAYFTSMQTQRFVRCICEMVEISHLLLHSLCSHQSVFHLSYCGHTDSPGGQTGCLGGQLGIK